MDGNGPDPATRAWVDRLRASAADDDRESIDYWRNASVEQHAKVLVELLDLGEAITRSRGRPADKPPLPPEKFPWPSMRRPA
jgi:hypothetical protein